MASSSDPRDDVDRLFSCFKCGISPPQSALKEKKPIHGKSKRLSLGRDDLENAVSRLGTSKTMMSARKQFSPVVFYGSPQGVPAKRPTHLLRLLREIRVDLTEQNDLNPREEVWATFPRQEQAMRFAKSHTQVYVLSYQDHLNGQRRFLVSTYEEFWRRYTNMEPKFRHHYEVIQEGFPCHMYFDLEFNKRANAEKNGSEMVDVLISVIFDALFDKFCIQGNKEWIIELDSSTDEKFSRHLIIRIPKTAFKDNLHVGAFVVEICSRIEGSRKRDVRLDNLYVSKELRHPEHPCQLFIDTAVYSRNRCFRLAFSSKAGKNSFLLPTRRFKCKNMSEQKVFMESLICRMDTDCKKLLTCKMDLDFKKTLHFDFEISGCFEQNSVIPQEVVLPCTSNFPQTYFMGKSPFPALDAFVESIASSGNESGRIRCWYWFSEYGLLVYSMSRNRYCERIGREHKSNHVMYIVDFRIAGYYQKCYDPDCKGYRSPMRPVPKGVIPINLAAFSSMQLEDHGAIMNTNFDQPYEESNMNVYNTSNNDEWITESCKRDTGWWLEAVKFAEKIENMRTAPEFHETEEDGEHAFEKEVAKVMSQFEDGTGHLRIG
ncbi:hypothetical protein QJS04_geneDACA013180 [Acorus gramineus]|uniref:DNA-directed primase/polymerase protein n=1 Tax=Acorus gramineus TaxID=55184 RepID=A0AAV9B955_ACOGR|nr:hypothetical protein QJS04_geneDACA013180 [Acorus gramineus]